MSLAYMDVGQGRKQDAEALRLSESHYFSKDDDHSRITNLQNAPGNGAHDRLLDFTAIYADGIANIRLY